MSSINVSLRILQRMSDARSSEAECSSVTEQWVDGRCWLSGVGGWQSVAAAGLAAVDDFNARDARQVEAFGNLSHCDKYLDVTVYDTGSSETVAYASVTDMFASPSTAPDVVVGPARSAVSLHTALPLGVRGIPQISYWSTSAVLDDANTYPLFMRTLPSDDSAAFACCQLWATELSLTRGAVIFVDDAYGRAYAQALEGHCYEAGVEVALFPFTYGDSASIRVQVNLLAALPPEARRGVLAITFSGDVTTLTEEAQVTGILRDGLFTFSDASGVASIGDANAATRTDLNGSTRLAFRGASDDNPSWLSFRDAWPSLSVEAMNARLPTAFDLPDGYFGSVDPQTDDLLRDIGAFEYDAVAAVGLLACMIAPTGPLPAGFGQALYDAKGALNFTGLTGQLAFDAIGNREKVQLSFELSTLLMRDDIGHNHVGHHVGHHDGHDHVASGTTEAKVAAFSGGAWSDSVSGALASLRQRASGEATSGDGGGGGDGDAMTIIATCVAGVVVVALMLGLVALARRGRRRGATATTPKGAATTSPAAGPTLVAASTSGNGGESAAATSSTKQVADNDTTMSGGSGSRGVGATRPGGTGDRADPLSEKSSEREGAPTAAPTTASSSPASSEGALKAALAAGPAAAALLSASGSAPGEGGAASGAMLFSTMLGWKKYRKFKPQYVLGRGASGVAVLLDDGKSRVVSKQIYIQDMSKSEVEKIETEVQILKELSRKSPRVIKYLDAFQERGVLCLITEYAEAGTLQQTIEARATAGGRFTDATVHVWLYQLASALALVHGARILHRDVKTTNVLLTRTGNVKLADFGLAKRMDKAMAETVMSQTACGTPYYLAPERVSGFLGGSDTDDGEDSVKDPSPYSRPADVWALGVVLYELLAFVRPFAARNIAQLFQSISVAAVDAAPLVASGHAEHLTSLVASSALLLDPAPTTRMTLDALLTHLRAHTAEVAPGLTPARLESEEPLADCSAVAAECIALQDARRDAELKESAAREQLKAEEEAAEEAAEAAEREASFKKAEGEAAEAAEREASFKKAEGEAAEAAGPTELDEVKVDERRTS